MTDPMTTGLNDVIVAPDGTRVTHRFVDMPTGRFLSYMVEYLPTGEEAANDGA